MSTAKRVGAVAVVALLVVGVTYTAHGSTYVINPEGTGDYPNIQAAVHAATDGDTIMLMDGTFRGDGNRDIQVPSRPIVICSWSGSYFDCQIDCEGSARAEHRGFRFDTFVGTGDASLQGIGIINGYTTTNGGGIWIDGADTEIKDCAVAFCTVDGDSKRGGGIYVGDGGSPTVTSSLFSGNTADYGGGIAVIGSGAVFQSCEVTDNAAISAAGGVYAQGTATVQFASCDIVSNTAVRAGGVRMAGSAIYFQNCNISRNEATSGHSGGVWLQAGFLNYCTIVENSATEGGGAVHCEAGTGGLNGCLIAFTEDGYGVAATAGNAPLLDCCDVYGNVGGNYDAEVGDQTGINNNFSLDPEFCGLMAGDYRLMDTSPCVTGVSPCGWQVGAFDVGCDDPVEGTSWGKLKALYR